MRKKYICLFYVIIALVCICRLSPALIAQEQDPRGQVAPMTQTENTDQGEQKSVQGVEDAHSEGHHNNDSGHAAEMSFLGIQIGKAGQALLKLINFLIFVGILFFLLKGVLSSAFKSRAADIEAKLKQSEKDRTEGEDQLRELEAKMAGLQEALDGIMAKAESDAEAEKHRILEAARSEADQILAQVQSEIEHQKNLAEKELRELVAKLALESAEKRIQQQIQGDAVTRVMDEAIERIGGAN